MDRGYAGASGLMGQKYEGEKELAKLGYGSAADLQRGQLDYQRWLAQLEDAYRQKQFGSAEQQQRFVNDAAIRDENWSRSLSNPAVSGAVTRNVNEAWSSPWAIKMMDDMEKRRKEGRMWAEPYYGLSNRQNLRPYGYSGAFVRPTLKK
jgi:hypothetical protein